ncbi:hypothetical protein [Vibrio owensii]|uniref:hypothetical protein n=1 Tax=Vibrio harveyi group TaxID=717610 RepID=UPI003CC6B0A2
MDKHDKAKKGMKFFAYFFLIMTVLTTAATVITNVSSQSHNRSESWTPIGAWSPEMMFMGNQVLGKGAPLIITEDSFEFAGDKKEVIGFKFIKELPQGQRVFHIVTADKETPFIMLSSDEAILQKGKIGFSFNRSTEDAVKKQLEEMKKNTEKQVDE